jgi:hypothetical protein
MVTLGMGIATLGVAMAHRRRVVNAGEKGAG